ncbi:hypothetical protein BURMUCGD2M_5719 [Burkholderia multivorans CGD2M]|uniref:Uncharacterized protein n=1 Tax=Burkholderia multivorans CGD2 TaxID=513052 RepID=B9BKX2_9BURK|nr:hypothetical protein BURMUCGD2_5729 [Burkholderia multivorans CGD2]EEE16275.1 hypothetical protein BURMUCGD2M_5719 [Burkholderia multivorans CGD2M]
MSAVRAGVDMSCRVFNAFNAFNAQTYDERNRPAMHNGDDRRFASRR